MAPLVCTLPGPTGQHAVHHVAVDSPNEPENAWDQMNFAHLSLVNPLKPVHVTADVDEISSHNGHLAVPPAALDNRLVPSPIPAQMKFDMNHKCAQITQDFMVPGHHGQHAVQHVVAASRLDQSNIHVAVRITFKNELVTKMPVTTNNGVNGVIALSHVAVEMLFVNVFTVALVKFKPIPNTTDVGARKQIVNVGDKNGQICHQQFDRDSSPTFVTVNHVPGAL